MIRMNKGNKTYFHDYLYREAFGRRGWARLGEIVAKHHLNYEVFIGKRLGVNLPNLPLKRRII